MKFISHKNQRESDWKANIKCSRVISVMSYPSDRTHAQDGIENTRRSMHLKNKNERFADLLSPFQW